VSSVDIEGLEQFNVTRLYRSSHPQSLGLQFGSKFSPGSPYSGLCGLTSSGRWRSVQRLLGVLLRVGMSVPEELYGAKGDRLAGTVLAPILTAMIYGLYEFVAWGVSSNYYLYTYVPVLGGLGATAGLLTYYFRALCQRNISWKNLLFLLGFLPFFFLIYIIGFLGFYTIYKGVMVSFSIWSILAGCFWVAIGYNGVNQFSLMTEIVRRHDEKYPLVN
jgi:hypothetical protein